MRLLVLAVAAGAASMVFVGHGNAAEVRKNYPVHLRVLPAPHEVAAPGVFHFRVRVVNVSGRAQRHVWFGSTGVLDGQPGWGGIKPVLDRRCKAGGGKHYCPLPPLRPGERLVLHGTVRVPLHILDHPQTTIGTHASAGVWLIRFPSLHPLSRTAGVRARVVAADHLPFTGIPLGMAVATGLGSCTVGLALTRVGRVTAASSGRASRCGSSNSCWLLSS